MGNFSVTCPQLLPIPLNKGINKSLLIPVLSIILHLFLAIIMRRIGSKHGDANDFPVKPFISFEVSDGLDSQSIALGYC